VVGYPIIKGWALRLCFFPDFELPSTSSVTFTGTPIELLVKILILGSSNGIPLLNCSGKSRVCSL
jgi:hypothetical protein